MLTLGHNDIVNIQREGIGMLTRGMSRVLAVAVVLALGLSVSRAETLREKALRLMAETPLIDG